MIDVLHLRCHLELHQLARAFHALLDLIELRHRAVDVPIPLDHHHWRRDVPQVIVADVPALEPGVEPDIRPAVESLARVAVIAAEALLQTFMGNMTSMFGMTVEEMNLTARVGSAPDGVPKYPELREATTVLNRVTQWREVGKPLVEGWAARYDGRFPPIDPARRHWSAYNESAYTDERYARALATKRRAVNWFEAEVLRRTARSCSEAVMLWDIGTGGRPSYRERALVEEDDGAAFLAVRPPTAGINGDSLCPIYGCVDMTVPIGQVPYRSRVTLVEEMVPVTVNVIARRGCDFVLWAMWERLADEGMLHDVKTGRTAF